MSTDFRVFNEMVYGLKHSVIASGYPKSLNLEDLEDDPLITYDEMVRADKLGNAKPGSGHDCYLKGIIVQMDITAPQYWWLQEGRYHFIDIVSSQSKMHKILDMHIDDQCNSYTDREIKDRLKSIINSHREEPTEENFQYLISNIPMGLMLTARVTTNYLQLKSMYNQRKNHKLEEWKVFCVWMKSLPYFEQFALNR